MGNPTQTEQITVGFKVRRDQVPAIKRIAKTLGYKSMAGWLQAIFQREFNKQVVKIVGEE